MTQLGSWPHSTAVKPGFARPFTALTTALTTLTTVISLPYLVHNSNKPVTHMYNFSDSAINPLSVVARAVNTIAECGRAKYLEAVASSGVESKKHE